MDLQNILEGIISSLVATVISGFIVFLYSKSKGKGKLMIGKSHKKLDISKINAFAVFLFITSFFVVISAFGFYYEWEKFPYLIFITILLGFLTAFIYNNQCPKCKKILTKDLTKKDVLKEEERPYYYRTAKVYLYTDRTERNREYSEEKKRMETWRTEKEHYKCRKCHHIWAKIFERNLDESTRPKIHKTIMTRDRNPNEVDVFEGSTE